MTISDIKNLIKSRRVALKLTLKEVADAVGVSESTVSRWEDGNIANMKRNRIAALAKVLDLSPNLLMGWEGDIESPLSNAKATGIKIPVLGRVVAGIPIEAVSEILDYEEISSELAAAGHYFALKIKGQSMEPRICEDDVVIVRQQQEVNSGDIAIILVNGEDATIKKVVFNDNGLTLIGFNTTVYPPHYYTNEEIAALPIKIVGKVVELRGKL